MDASILTEETSRWLQTHVRIICTVSAHLLEIRTVVTFEMRLPFGDGKLQMIEFWSFGMMRKSDSVHYRIEQFCLILDFELECLLFHATSSRL